MLIDEIKASLEAYNTKDLQHMNHILQIFEEIGADYPTVRRVIQDAINSALGKHRLRVKRSEESNALAQKTHAYCPQCNISPQLMTPILVNEDGLDILIMQCKKCRYSYLV